MKAGWEIKSLDNVTNIINGGTPKSAVSEFWGGEVAWLTPKDMGKLSNHNVSSTSRTITQLGLSKCSAKLIPMNSIILSTRAPIGHLAINSVPMAFNQGCRGLVPNDSLILKYLFHYLSANIDVMNDLGTGTTFKELSASALKSLQIPLPPLEEQKRIVSILDEAFEGLERARENAEANLKSARELFANLLNATFENNNEQWTHSNLGTTCKFIGGSQPPKANFTLEDGEGLVRLVQIRDYKSDKNITFIPKTLARRFCTVNDVMIGRYGPPLFQILRGIEGAYNVALMKAEPNPELLSKDYLYFFLRNSRILKYIIDSSNRAAGQIGLNKATIEPYPISYPNLAEQRRIVAKLEKAEIHCKTLEIKYKTKLQDISDLRQSLLQKAFAGELT